MHAIKKLKMNQQFTDLDVLEIDSPSCRARIALQGAQILQYQPKHRANSLLWLSKANTGQVGKALRGGFRYVSRGLARIRKGYNLRTVLHVTRFGNCKT
ncbi:hypothetical protein [Acinetobacter sp. ANC 5502]